MIARMYCGETAGRIELSISTVLRYVRRCAQIPPGYTPVPDITPSRKKLGPRASASFQRSPRLVGRLGSGLRVSASF